MTAVTIPDCTTTTPRILVPVDLSRESWRVLPLANNLARRIGGRVQPVFVDVSTLGAHAVLERSVRLVASVDDEPISISVVPGSDVAATLRDLLADAPDSWLLMSTHGLGAITSQSWGCVSDELFRTTTVPVVAVGPCLATKVRDVAEVVALADPVAPDEAVIHDAAEWAGLLGVPLVVAVVSGRPCSSAHSAEVLADRLADRVRTDGVAVTTRILDGIDVAGAVVSLAEQSPDSLVAMSVSPLPGATALSREVTMRIARDMPAPMLLRGSSRLQVPSPRRRTSTAVDLARGTDCHDTYDVDLAGTVSTAAAHRQGTSCHDDYWMDVDRLDTSAASPP